VAAVERAEVVRREAVERAERERLRKIEEQRRAEEAKRERIEGEKAKRLKGLLKERHFADEIRTYVVAQRAILESLDDAEHRGLLEEWLAWASQHADKIDPIRTFAIPVIEDPGEYNPWRRERDDD